MNKDQKQCSHLFVMRSEAFNFCPRCGMKIAKVRICTECGIAYRPESPKGDRPTRKFCSYKCGQINSARRQREKDPDAYRAKQREIMRKKSGYYEKRGLSPNDHSGI